MATRVIVQIIQTQRITIRALNDHYYIPHVFCYRKLGSPPFSIDMGNNSKSSEFTHTVVE